MAADPGSTDLVGKLKMLSPGRKKLMSKYFMLKEGESRSLVSEYFGVALAFVALGGMIRDVNLLKAKTKQQQQEMMMMVDHEREPPKLHRMALEEMLKAAMERLRALAAKTQSLEEKMQERRNMEAGFQYERMELLKRAMAAETVVVEKAEAEAAWRLEKAELQKRVAEADAQRDYFFNKMTEAEIRVTELNRLRAEDGKANAKLVAIYASREQGWKTDKMKLRQEIDLLKERLAKLMLESRTRAEEAVAAATVASSLESIAEAHRTRRNLKKSEKNEKILALESQISVSSKQEDGMKARQMLLEEEDVRGLKRGSLLLPESVAGDHHQEEAGESIAAHEVLLQQQEMEAELAIILKRVGMLKRRGSGDNMLSDVHSSATAAATASKSLVQDTVPVIDVTQRDIVDKRGIQEQPDPFSNEQQGIGEKPECCTSVQDVGVVADKFRKEIMHTVGSSNDVVAKTSQEDLHLVITTCEPSSYDGNPSPAKMMMTAEVPNAATDKDIPSDSESTASTESQGFDTSVCHWFAGASGERAAATESQDFDTMGVCLQFGDTVATQASHTVEWQKSEGQCAVCGEGPDADKEVVKGVVETALDLAGISMQQEIGTSGVVDAHAIDRDAICKDVVVVTVFDSSSILHMLPSNAETSGVTLQLSPSDPLSNLPLVQEIVSDKNLVEDDIAGTGGSGIKMPVVEQAEEIIIAGIDNVSNEALETEDSSWGIGDHTVPENPKLYQSGDQEPPILPFTGIEDSSLEILKNCEISQEPVILQAFTVIGDSSLEILENHEISQEPVILPFPGIIEDSSLEILKNREISQEPVILPFTGIIVDSSLEILENCEINHDAAGACQSFADSKVVWGVGIKESFMPSQEDMSSRKGLSSGIQLTTSDGFAQEVVDVQQYTIVDGEHHLPSAEIGNNRSLVPKLSMELDATDSRPQGSMQSFKVEVLHHKEEMITCCVAPFNDELPQQFMDREHVASLTLVTDPRAGILWDGEVGHNGATSNQSLAENKEAIWDVEDEQL
ncbi:unnamed protein product [Sphagnum jensenii]|uniref:Uncharacterized protein n=1 Tax=Sphagnum jensenii TaxID=128206 RepID=A0ABP1B2N6_9BRYO